MECVDESTEGKYRNGLVNNLVSSLILTQAHYGVLRRVLK